MILGIETSCVGASLALLARDGRVRANSCNVSFRSKSTRSAAKPSVALRARDGRVPSNLQHLFALVEHAAGSRTLGPSSRSRRPPSFAPLQHLFPLVERDRQPNRRSRPLAHDGRDRANLCSISFHSSSARPAAEPSVVPLATADTCKHLFPLVERSYGSRMASPRGERIVR